MNGPELDILADLFLTREQIISPALFQSALFQTLNASK